MRMRIQGKVETRTDEDLGEIAVVRDLRNAAVDHSELRAVSVGFATAIADGVISARHPYNARVLAAAVNLGLPVVALGVAVLNLPFGYWRAGTQRFSLPWFLAIHLPVPVVLALRIASGHGFDLTTIPVLVAAFFAGQFLGARIRVVRERHEPPEVGG